METLNIKDLVTSGCARKIKINRGPFKGVSMWRQDGVRVGRQKGGLWWEGVGSKGLTLKHKNLLSKALGGDLSVCSQDRVSCFESKVFYLPSFEIIYSPVTFLVGSGDVRVGMAVGEMVLSEVCVGDSFSLLLVEYFYLDKLGIPSIPL